MGIFGEDEQDTRPRRPRGRKPAPRKSVEVSLDAVSYEVDVEFVNNETDKNEGGEVTVEFQLSTNVADAEVESHWPELSGNVSYKARSSGRGATDLADRINDAYAAIGHALKQWAQDAERWQ